MNTNTETNMLTIEMIDKTQIQIPMELAEKSNVIKEELRLFSDNIISDSNSIYYYLEPNSQEPDVIKDLFNFYKITSDYSFFENYDKNKLFKFIIASNYLDCSKALDNSTTYVANIIKKCKTPQEIKEKLNIHDD